MNKQLNAVQVAQFNTLTDYTNQAFSDLILDHTFIVSESELNETIENILNFIKGGECYQYSFDENFYSVACDYVYCDHEAIKIEFNKFYGTGAFYMDAIGRGLMVSMY